MKPATLRLTRPLEEGIRKGHPWAFRDAVESPAGLQTGQVVDLVDKKGAFVARGTVDPDSPLTFRAWTLDPSEAVGDALIERRLSAALTLRREILTPDITAFRVCHGENDHLPGLQCDLYGDVVSMRTDGGVGRAWEERFAAAVRALLAPRAIVCRNHAEEEGAARVLFGDAPEEVTIQERDRRFVVDVLRGQKTGFFLDQRDNRDRVAALARGRKVLNLFSYTGGFSVAAARAGAARVVSCDIARPAVESARRNFALNGLPAPEGDFLAMDAFDLLAEQAQRPGQFDLIVLDPPSFASSRKVVPRATLAYTKLSELALRALPPGGWLATASCSSHIREADFLDIVIEATRRAGRKVTVAGVHGAAPDHPTRLGFPEGHYLKFVLLKCWE